MRPAPMLLALVVPATLALLAPLACGSRSGLSEPSLVVADAGFGTQVQALRPLASLQEGAVRLA